MLRGVKIPEHPVVTMLGVTGTLQASRDGETLTVVLPEFGPDGAPCKHAYVLKIVGAQVQPEEPTAALKP